MFRLELDVEEHELLVQILERSLSELRMEIAGTENYDFREGLKRQEEILKRILLALQQPAPMPQG